MKNKLTTLYCNIILGWSFRQPAGVLLSAGLAWVEQLLSSERERGSVFIQDYNKDSKGLLGIFKCERDLGGWSCWLRTLLSVELQLHIYLQLLSDCFEHFLCKTKLLERAMGMAAAVKGL